MDKLENPTPEDMQRIKLIPPLEPSDIDWLQEQLLMVPGCDQKDRVVNAICAARPFAEVAASLASICKVLALVDLVAQAEEEETMVPRKGGIN
jgi:hypothetical protein